MRKSQNGFYNLDVVSLLVTLGIVAIVIGVSLDRLCIWIWPMLKHLIHQLTA